MGGEALRFYFQSNASAPSGLYLNPYSLGLQTVAGFTYFCFPSLRGVLLTAQPGIAIGVILPSEAPENCYSFV